MFAKGSTGTSSWREVCGRVGPDARGCALEERCRVATDRERPVMCWKPCKSALHLAGRSLYSTVPRFTSETVFSSALGQWVWLCHSLLVVSLRARDPGWLQLCWHHTRLHVRQLED